MTSTTQFTDLESCRHADGSITLRFSTDTAIQEVTLAPEADHLLLAAALMSGPAIVARHDGFALGDPESESPVLMFQFGPSRWLSIRLEQADLQVLETLLPRR